MDKHTQEPWSRQGCTIHSADGQTITHLFRCKESDARRIVACINACAGISIEDLERGVLRDAAATLHDIHTAAIDPNDGRTETYAPRLFDAFLRAGRLTAYLPDPRPTPAGPEPVAAAVATPDPSEDADRLLVASRPDQFEPL